MKRHICAALLIAASTTTYAMEAPTWGGDLRYRNERIDQDGRDARVRNRVRARLKLNGKVEENLSYGFRLASGGDDPVSTNQSLDSGFSTKGLQLDLAYLKYKHSLAHIKAGKMKNPWEKAGKTELVWDGDLNPEGANIYIPVKMLFLNLGYLWTEERSSGPDSTIHGAQLGVKHKTDSFGIKVGVSYFDFTTMKGESPLYDSTDSFGNSTTGGNYTNDYNLLEAFLEVNIKTKLPVNIYIDYVTNGEAKTNDTGYLAGFSVGKKFKFSYNYRQVEADAVVGVFTDSDFKGGGTDGKGHEIGLAYSPTKKTKFGFSHFMNKTAVKNGQDYTRSMLDFSLKF